MANTMKGKKTKDAVKTNLSARIEPSILRTFDRAVAKMGAPTRTWVLQELMREYSLKAGLGDAILDSLAICRGCGKPYESMVPVWAKKMDFFPDGFCRCKAVKKEQIRTHMN